MISKPQNWNDIVPATGEYKTIEPGGYVCIIRKVTDVPISNDGKGNYLSLEFDICEGDLKGYAVDKYEHFGKWPFDCQTKVSYKDKAMGMFKAFIDAVEQTNPGFQFDFMNPQCLVNKGVGVIYGEEEYYSTKDRVMRVSVKPRAYTTAGKVRSNDYKMPNLKKFKGEIPVDPVSEPSFTEITSDDGQFPF